MRLGPRALELVLLGEGEDVVAQHVVLAVVLMKTAGLRAIDHVVLQHDVARTLVGIEPPAAVAEGIDVVEAVVVYARAGRDAQRVDAAHVGKDMLAERVHVIESDVVVVGMAGRVAPDPADGNAGIVEIEDVVVLDAIVGRMADPDPDARGMQPAAMGDQALPHGVVRHDLLRLVGRGAPAMLARRRGLADQHPAAAQVDQFAAIDKVVPAAGAEGQGVAADVPHGTGLEGDVPRRHGRQRPADVHFGLGIALALRIERPIVVGERQPAKNQVLDPLPRRRVALRE